MCDEPPSAKLDPQFRAAFQNVSIAVELQLTVSALVLVVTGPLSHIRGSSVVQGALGRWSGFARWLNAWEVVVPLVQLRGWLLGWWALAHPLGPVCRSLSMAGEPGMLGAWALAWSCPALGCDPLGLAHAQGLFGFVGGLRASSGISPRHLLEAFAPVPAVFAYPGILRQAASSRAVVLGWYVACSRGLRAGPGHARHHLDLSEASAPVPAFPCVTAGGFCAGSSCVRLPWHLAAGRFLAGRGVGVVRRMCRRPSRRFWPCCASLQGMCIVWVA